MTPDQLHALTKAFSTAAARAQLSADPAVRGAWMEAGVQAVVEAMQEPASHYPVFADPTTPADPPLAMLRVGLAAADQEAFVFDGAVVKYKTPPHALLAAAYRAMRAFLMYEQARRG